MGELGFRADHPRRREEETGVAVRERGGGLSYRGSVR